MALSQLIAPPARVRRVVLPSALSLLVLFTVGCGGGGGGGEQPTKGTVDVKITWPARTKDLPTYTNSVKVEIKGTDLVGVANRPAGDAQVTQTVRFNSVDFGAIGVGLTGYEGKDGGGAKVAEGDTEIVVGSGSNEVNVSTVFKPVVKAIRIVSAPDEFIIGKASDLAAEAKDSGNNVVLISDAWKWSITGDATIDNGRVLATRYGSAKVTLSLSGMPDVSTADIPTLPATIRINGPASMYTNASTQLSTDALDQNGSVVSVPAGAVELRADNAAASIDSSLKLSLRPAEIASVKVTARLNTKTGAVSSITGEKVIQTPLQDWTFAYMEISSTFGKIYTSTVDSRTVKEISQISASDDAPAMSPSGEYIATWHGGSIDLYRTDGTYVRQVYTGVGNTSNGGTLAGAACFSADEQWLVFFESVWTPGKMVSSRLLKVRVDGTQPTYLTGVLTPSYDPYCTKSDKVVYSSKGTDAFENDNLWQTDLNGGPGSEVQVTHSRFRDRYPASANDGSGGLYFSRNLDTSNTYSMRLMNPDGSLKEITNPTIAGTVDRRPHPSPDGRRIIFQRNVPGTTAKIYVANVFTGQIQQWTQNTFLQQLGTQ